MFTNKNSLQIKLPGGTYISLGQYLVEVEYQYPKLWANDTGRNLKGKQSGTLIGIFPKIVCQFRKLTKDELILLRPILDAPTQIVKYYDPWKQELTEMETYSGDWAIKNNYIIDNNRKNQGFQISFIAREKR